MSEKISASGDIEQLSSASTAGHDARDRMLFNRIASSYAKKDLHPPSRTAREARLRQTIKLAGSTSDADILEVGCGAGFAAKYLRGRYRTYTGIDYSEELISFARNIEVSPGVVFHSVNLYDWRPREKYDVILAIGVLHHLSNIPRAMAGMHAMLRPGGQLVVNEPQPSNVICHHLRRFRRLIDTSYSNEQRELSRSELRCYFSDAGFEQIETRGQGLLSTPFAEAVLRPAAFVYPLSALACRVDSWLEEYLQSTMKALTWNIIVSGRRTR